MGYHADQQAHAYADAAWHAMQRHHVAPTPDNFRIWYSYAAGTDPALNQAIDALLAQGADFNATRSLDLFERFFSVETNSEMLADAGSRLKELVDQVVTTLSQAHDDTSAFGDTVGGLQREFAAQSDIRAASSFATRLLEETTIILARQTHFERQLAAYNEEVERLRQSVADLRREADTDALTGLANRRHFERQLEAEVAHAQASSGALSLVVADIDHFKTFNDCYGHAVGDVVLKTVARHLVRNLKGQDFLARIGGEEFVALLPQTSLAAATTVAANIQATLAKSALRNRQSGESYGKVTLSLGVASYRPEEPPTVLLARADAAMYLAKQTGRNCVRTEGDLEPASD